MFDGHGGDAYPMGGGGHHGGHAGGGMFDGHGGDGGHAGGGMFDGHGGDAHPMGGVIRHPRRMLVRPHGDNACCRHYIDSNHFEHCNFYRCNVNIGSSSNALNDSDDSDDPDDSTSPTSVTTRSNRRINYYIWDP